MKILLIVISFVLHSADGKINNEKPQAPPVPSIMYTFNVNPAITQQTIRGFGGALTNSNINTFFNNANNGQLKLMVVINRNAFSERARLNVDRKMASASFLSHLASKTKKFTTESAIDVSGTSFTYDLPSLNITNLSQVRKVLVIKRIVTVVSEII